MKYEAGNRFNPDTYFKTEADSSSITVKVTGELEGVEVSFDSGDVPEITSLSVTENGTYEAPEGTAYDPVTVEVPNTYTESDEGKVVSSGALVTQTSTTKTANGTYDTTLNNEVVVAVPGPSGSISITQNGTVDVTNYASAEVNVPSGSSDMIALIQRSVTSFVIPNGCTKIGKTSFANCASLASITIPEGVTEIGEQSFINDGSLQAVSLPSSVNLVRSQAFSYSGLRDLTCLATTPPVLDSSTVFGTNIQHIYVPAGSVETYKTAANWDSHASKIEAIPTP